MAELRISEFLAMLEKSQLLSAAQMKTLRQQLTGSKYSAEELANTLVAQNHLTNWQAKQLLKCQTGFLLEHYRLLNPIGRGGMGHVFRGLNSKTKDVVAVKVMVKKLTGNQALVSRFRREIRANARLNCPHIVKSLDAGRVGKTDFMVMEFVNGDQVDRIANRLGRLPAGLACEIVRQIAVGLQHAHEHQMVHRDIKPGNMMVHWLDSEEGVVKLMDMGLVLLTSDDPDEKTVTRAGQVMGTPDYMSPEQGWDTTQVDIRSDIYSLGCTLFRLLSGSVPFTGTNPLQVLSQRLQRDAPSVKTVCEDISDDVAAIVSKMTARDPDSRYQTPNDVAAALAPHCEPLNKSAMKAAARKSNQDFTLNSDDSNSNEIDETDGTYQQFLKEVQDGSVVDLMLATDPGDSPIAATVPLLSIDHSSPGLRRREQTSSVRRGQKTSFIVMGVTALLVLAAAAWAFRNQPPENVNQPVVNQPVKQKLPDVTIQTTELSEAKTGELWAQQLDVDISGNEADIRFELGSIAPVEMQIDASSGKLSWQVPNEQTLTTYTVPIRVVCDVDGTETMLTESTLSVKVVRGFQSLPWSDFDVKEVPPGEMFQFSVAIDPIDAGTLNLRYQLAGRVPPEMKIDELTGLITWTPSLLELGRHPLEVSVVDSDSPKLRKTTNLNLLVVPTHIDHVLPPIPQQQAVAGKIFSFDFSRSRPTGRPRMPAVRLIKPGPNAPAGLTIDPVSQLLTWKIPDDTTGTVKIPLVAVLDAEQMRRARDLAGVAFLELDVSAGSSKPMSTLPPDAEIASAMETIKETYSRSISQARTTTERATLASRLLEQTFDAKPGAADAALLQLIETELATKARATDVLLRIGQIRAQRYGMDELVTAATTIDGVRKTSLNQRQQDLVVEHSMRLSKLSATARQFELTDDLLDCVGTLLGRSPQGAAAEFLKDVTAAQKLATDLAKSTDAELDARKVRELSRLLDRWQFQRVFADSSSLLYVQLSPGNDVPLLDGNGRDLWVLEAERVRLESTTQPTLLAIVDRTTQAEEFVFRFEVEAGSNSAQLLFGATVSGANDFAAYRLTLDSSGPGQIQALNSTGILNDPAKTVPPVIYADQSNLVELVVNGTAVVLRINGLPVSQANIPNLAAGQLGIAADLRRPQPRLTVRNPRILIIPQSD